MFLASVADIHTERFGLSTRVAGPRDRIYIGSSSKYHINWSERRRDGPSDLQSHIGRGVVWDYVFRQERGQMRSFNSSRADHVTRNRGKISPISVAA